MKQVYFFSKIKSFLAENSVMFNFSKPTLFLRPY